MLELLSVTVMVSAWSRLGAKKAVVNKMTYKLAIFTTQSRTKVSKRIIIMTSFRSIFHSHYKIAISGGKW